MYNRETPSRGELPTSGQLLRSTVIAAAAAAVLLATVVLPAEYGIDPTGVGRVLGLTEMGDIKTRLAQEAAADAAAVATPMVSAPVAIAPEPAAAPAPAAIAPSASGSVAPSEPAAPPPASAGSTAMTSPSVAAAASVGAPSAPQAADAWRDEVSFTLTPGEGTEIKLRMNAGDKAYFAWSAQGGVVNYDTHGDGGGRSISYVKGRGVPADEGELMAAFTGNHGWFWRNRGSEDVTVTLKTRGDYSALLRVK